MVIGLMIYFILLIIMECGDSLIALWLFVIMIIKMCLIVAGSNDVYSGNMLFCVIFNPVARVYVSDILLLLHSFIIVIVETKSSEFRWWYMLCTYSNIDDDMYVLKM